MSASLNLTWPTVVIIVALVGLAAWLCYLDRSAIPAILGTLGVVATQAEPLLARKPTGAP